MFTDTQRTTLKTYLSNQIEKARRKIMPPSRPTGSDFDKVIEDMKFIRNLLTEVESAPKEGMTPIQLSQEKVLENENSREHPNMQDPAKETQKVLPQ